MWASDPYPGSMHDAAALDASGLLDGIDPSGWIADKGYVGRGMITPHKKPPNGELSETAKEENKSVMADIKQDFLRVLLSAGVRSRSRRCGW